MVIVLAVAHVAFVVPPPLVVASSQASLDTGAATDYGALLTGIACILALVARLHIVRQHKGARTTCHPSVARIYDMARVLHIVNTAPSVNFFSRQLALAPH